MMKAYVTLNVPVCIEKDGEGYYAYSPVFKGVHVDGDTKEDALKNAQVACELYIQSLLKHGDTVPVPMS